RLSSHSVSAYPSSPPFFFDSSGDHRHLPSFPTRRSSDLPRAPACGRRAHWRVRRAGHRPGAVAGDRAVGGRDDVRRHQRRGERQDRKSTRLNSSHVKISYAVFCLKKKKKKKNQQNNTITT